MTTKHKFVRKRGSEHLRDMTSTVIEATEIIISRSKKRKNTSVDIFTFADQEAADAQIQARGQGPVGSQQGHGNKCCFVEKDGNTFSVIAAPNKEKCVRSRYKKTYASPSKTGPLSSQTKTKQSAAAKTVVLIKSSKDIGCKSAAGNDMGKEKPQLAFDSVDRLLSASSSVQVTDCREVNSPHVAASNCVIKKEKECLIYVQSPSCADGKTKAERSWPALTAGEHHQVADSECPKKRCNTSGSLTANELVPHISHSHNPVLKQMTSVPGVPVTSPMPSLSASTEAITAISTPIPTFPKLPDVLGDNLRQVTQAVGKGGSCPASASQEVDEPHLVEETHTQHQASVAESCYGTIQHDQEIITPLRYKDPGTGVPFPVVDISSESGDLCLKEEEILNPAENSIKSVFHPSEAIQSSTTSQQPGFLQADTWAAHVLQNLEAFYRDERHCDVTLKFCGGELLKVHRTVLLACTALVSAPDATQDQSEVVVPADLTFASVEPIIRFAYSGRLEIKKPVTEMSAVYAAAKRLKVSLLTHIMEQHFPHLSQSCTESLASSGESKKQISARNISSAFPTSSACPQSALQGSCCKAATSKGTLMAAEVKDEQVADAVTSRDVSNVERIKLEECEEEEEEEASVYYLATNSAGNARKYSYSSPGRCRKTAEEARPTRFELEEDPDQPPLRITTTWGTNSSPPSPPCMPATPQVSTSNITSPPATSSALVGCSSSETCTSTNSSLVKAFRKYSSSPNKKVRRQPSRATSPITALVDSGKQSIELVGDVDVPSERLECDGAADAQQGDHVKETESGKENVDLMERISSICKQLEEKELNDVEEIHEVNLSGRKSEEKSHSLSSDKKAQKRDESAVKSSLRRTAATPVKSILKKSKNKVKEKKEAKHVSFQLDENNELINEVATFSLTKEPAQSLIEVQKTRGNAKSLRDAHAPVKLTVSMKKKVLKNLTLSDSETIGPSGLQVKKSHGKKGIGSSSQGHGKNHVNKGDISSHAKIISEVLKKYPHLVKDKKKIRLKILKKGNEREGGGKAKSRVQYLVLSDGDSKSKSVTRTYKASLSKHDVSTAQAGHNQHTFECPECINKTFKTYFMLKKHVLAEHKGKTSVILSQIDNVPYACYMCFRNEPLEFDSYFSYQQHMKDVHSRLELRLCNICGFRPGRKLELAYHQYTEHNKVSRTFCFPKCDLCDHVAINDAALLKHRSQHTNADNYTCSVCGVKFCSFGALQGHMQTKLCQTKPSVSHKCPHCSLTFARSYNLKAHCKSSHKSLQAPQSMPQAKDKQPQDLASHSVESQSGETERGSDAIETNSNSDYKDDIVDADVKCEAQNSVSAHSSSEAEALSTVASSLAASLGLPEETINHYVYTEDKMEYSDTMDVGKVEEVVSQPVDLAVHLEVPSVSECQANLQTSAQSSTSMSALFPISVMPGQILPSQVLQSGCLDTSNSAVLGASNSTVFDASNSAVLGASNSAVLNASNSTVLNVSNSAVLGASNSAVLGAASQGWTYVTYQVPSTGDELPVVITETTSIVAAPSGNPHHHSTTTENVYHSAGNVATVESVQVSVAGMECSESAGSVCEGVASVTVTEAEMNRSINQTSSLSVTHTYDSLSSQFA